MAVYGFNFRQTSGFVTDGTDETYVIGEAYPVTRGGFTFGWDSDISGDTRDRNSGIGPHFAGINFGFNADVAKVWRLDLTATGTYNIRIAAGDHGNSQAHDIEFADDTSYVTIANNITSALDEFLDTTATSLTRANWTSSNVPLEKTFSTTIFRIRMCNLSASTAASCLAHVSIESAAVVRRWLLGATH